MMRVQDIQPGDVITYNTKSYRVTVITSHRDQVHGRIYHLELEADGERVSVAVREGALILKP